MSLFKKLFGGGASLEALRKAVEQKRYADARYIADQLGGRIAGTEDGPEFEQLRIQAGDGLARLNLEEALGMQRCGKLAEAGEHLSLALAQVCSTALREEIEQALAIDAVIAEDLPTRPGQSPSCASCSPALRPLTAEDAGFYDTESQLELILTSYPDDLVQRYQLKSGPFKEALLLSHAGEDEQALHLWRGIDVAEQDDLYWFELGSLLGRCGHPREARKALEKAIKQNPGMVLAVESLASVLIAMGDVKHAESELLGLLGRGGDPAFCHAQLAKLYVQQNDPSRAEEHVRLTLAEGPAEPGFLVLAASVLERNGALEDAEAVLKSIPGSGCGGGVNLPLAEFWLRRGRELGRVLDTFNAACREDPGNPRWQLRVAQTYLARNWKKDGVKLLRKVIGDPRLAPELLQEAEALLAEANG